jgi:hypothetical protein
VWPCYLSIHVYTVIVQVDIAEARKGAHTTSTPAHPCTAVGLHSLHSAQCVPVKVWPGARGRSRKCRGTWDNQRRLEPGPELQHAKCAEYKTRTGVQRLATLTEGMGTEGMGTEGMGTEGMGTEGMGTEGCSLRDSV